MKRKLKTLLVCAISLLAIMSLIILISENINQSIAEKTSILD